MPKYVPSSFALSTVGETGVVCSAGDGSFLAGGSLLIASVFGGALLVCVAGIFSFGLVCVCCSFLG